MKLTKNILAVLIGVSLGLGGTVFAVTNVSLTKNRALQYLNYIADSFLIGGTATTSDARLSVVGSTTVTGTGMFGGELRVPNIVATSSATSTFPVMYSSTSTVSNLNGVIYVDGVRFAKTGEGIGSAISQACGSQGGKVILPAGNYIFTSYVAIKSNCVIEGQGSSTVLTLADNINQPLFKTLTAVTNCELKNFSINGNSQNNTSPGPSGNTGISLTGGTNKCYLHDISIDSVYGNAIEIDASDNNVIERINTSNNALSIRVTNGSDENLIQNNISNHDEYGIFIYHNNTDTFSYRNKVIGNTVKNGHGTNDALAQAAGISLTGAPYSLVSHNLIINNKTRGIEVYSTSTGSIINENTVIGNGTTTYMSGIDTGPDANLIISKNYIEASGGAGIYLSGNTSNTVIGNVIKNNGQSGTDSSHVYGGITIQENNDDGTAPVRNNIVTGNRVFDDQEVHTQQYGIVEAWTGAQQPLWYTNNVYSGNILSGNVRDDLRILSTSSAVYGNIFSGDTNPFSVSVSSSTKLLTVLTGGNVGISTSSPYAKLSVLNTGIDNSFVVDDQLNDASPFIIDNTGKVGIGTTSPSYSLHVLNTLNSYNPSDTSFDMNSSDRVIAVHANNAFFGGESALVFTNNATSTPASGIVGKFYGSGNYNDGRLGFFTNNTGSFSLGAVLSSTGFGVATTSPGSLLSVGGVANFTTASSTFYSTGGINLSGGCYAIAGVCIGGGTSSSFPYLFPLTGNATSSSLMILASTTIGNGTQQEGLTINGGATTTGNLIVQGAGTSSVYSKFEIRPVGTQSAGDFTVDPVNKTVYIGRLSATGGDHSTFQVRDRSGSDIFSVIPSSAFAYFGQPSVGGFGVGTTSPMSRFSILNTGAGGTVRIEDQANDTSPFVIDTNGKVGMSTGTPNNPLTVVGNSDFWGNLGIGTTSPYAKLSVVGEVVSEYFTATSTSATSTVKWRFSIGTSTSNEITFMPDVVGTSTFTSGYGIDLSAGGCYAIGGTCVSGVLSLNGGTNQFLYKTGAQSTQGGMFYVDTSNQSFAFGTSSAMAKLTIAATDTPQLLFTDPNGSTNNKHFYASSSNGFLNIGTILDTPRTLSPKWTFATNGSFGVGTTTPWAQLSVVSTDSSRPAFFVGTSTDRSSWGITAFWDSTMVTRGFWDIWIGGATTSQRYNKDDVTIFGAINNDTLVTTCTPSNNNNTAAIVADSNLVCGGSASFDLIGTASDSGYGVTSMATSTFNGVATGCNDGGDWEYVYGNINGIGVADDAAWVRGGVVIDTSITAPAAVAGGQFTSTGTPTMEITVCIPNVGGRASSTLYGFGFGDTIFGTSFVTNAAPSPLNSAWLGASSTENWRLVNTNTALTNGSYIDTGVSTTTTQSPTTFRLTKTATATYAWRYNAGTGGWESIGSNTANQTSRNFTWFVGLQQGNASTGQIPEYPFYFRNLKIWYSPTYRF